MRDSDKKKHDKAGGREKRYLMKKGIQKIGLLLLVLSLALSGNQTAGTVQAAGAKIRIPMQAAENAQEESPSTETDGKEDEEPCDSVSLLQIEDYSASSVTLSWFSDGNNDGFYVYRKCKYDKAYKKLGSVKNTPYATHYFKDSNFKRGIKFTYKIVAYRLDDTGTATEGAAFLESIRVDIPKATLASVKRSGSKVTVKWKKISGVSGYEIYRKIGGEPYQRVKTVSSADTVKWVSAGVSANEKASYKVRAFVKYQGNSVYGSFSAVKSIYSASVQRVINQFKKLQKQYPTGKYWNHVNKSKYNSSTVTNTPCQHYSRDDISTCNHYNCPNGILGYQCYGFAWKMSDLIYGRTAKIKKIKSFQKCKMGDVIRYSGHSAIITEKHKNYVVVGECNYGNTCMILWGRKVYKSELLGATYSRRYR